MTITRKALQRVGNSTGLILPADLLKEAGLSRDDEVVIRAERGRITLTRLDPEFDDLVDAAEAFISRYPNALRKLAE